jgi:DNA-binding CsgD family transcriptional regulator
MFDVIATPAQAQQRPPLLARSGFEAGTAAPVAVGEAVLARCMRLMLDEIDYAMVVVGADCEVLYMNHWARVELDHEHPLQLLGRSLRAARPQDLLPLADALAAARRGLRRLITLGAGEQRVTVSVVPLLGPADGGPITQLALGKRQVCQQLSIHGFARDQGLTPTETRVLELLSDGVKPTEIAACQGVAVSTVRTQIGSIRSKTGASSIRELLRLVARLPPLVGALRGVMPARTCAA